jgi:beta-galactosidase
VIPDSETRVHFSAVGPANIIAVDNGNLLDHDPFHATDRKLYDGHAIAILRAVAPKGPLTNPTPTEILTGATGRITITATTEGLPPATITFTTRMAKPSTDQRSF